MTTVPPSPAQGETAGVSEERLAELVGRVAVDYVTDSGKVNRRELAAICGELLAARHQLAELQRENSALRNLANNLQPGPISEALAGTRYTREAELEQQLAEMRGALELADSYIREHTDHHGDCELSQSDGDAPCSCDYGFTLTQIDVALAPTSQPSRCPTCGGAKALFEPHEPGSTHKIIDCPDCAQPSRGKCERCGGDGIKRFGVYKVYDEMRGEPEPCPDCAQGGSPADPERQGADAVALIAGLEMLRDKPMSVSSFVISSIADRAIAALKGAK